MTLSNKYKQRITFTIAMLMSAMAVGVLPACDDFVTEPEGDCDPVYRIHFKYDMNMKFADAFPSEVPSVNLYLFDSSGKLVAQRSEAVTKDNAQGFYYEFRDLPPAVYNAIAWCGVKDNPAFSVNHSGVEAPGLTDHTCLLTRDADNTVDFDAGYMYHGMLDGIDMTFDEGTHDYTVSLTKDTNVVRVVLQHLSGAPINPGDYLFEITEANGLLAHDNSLLQDDVLRYRPWIVDSGTAEFGKNEEKGTRSSVSAVIAEFTVSRLMAERDAVLTVRSAYGGNRTILSIPLTDYLLLVKGNYNRKMSDQEYLDRQDEYPMTFFLDERDNWIDAFIYINSWRVVLQNTDVE